MKLKIDQQLNEMALRVRNDIISMSYRAKSAHMGGALSVVEILVALYGNIMHYDAKTPNDPSRDRLIFSKAHDGKALFAVLAVFGFFPKKMLLGYEANDGKLPGHSTRHCVPGVEVSAGGLGHGLSMAAGMAYALKIQNPKFKIQMKRKPRVFAILSDGECDEGSTWEAALFASHHHLDNLVVIVDYNKLQGYGKTKDVLQLEPFTTKWSAFGFSVQEVDGHSFDALIDALSLAPSTKGKPSVIIAHTIKGLGGPSQHINQISSQYKSPTEEEYTNLVGR